MTSREEVLRSLVESVEAKTEGIATTLGALVAGSALVANALAPSTAPTSKPYAAIPLARKLATADSRAEELDAVVGLLTVCAKSLIRLNDQADLGHRLRHIITALSSRVGR